MKRRVVEILRENHLTYMREGKEVYTHIEEKDGMRYVTRPEVPLTLEIEEGYVDLGKRMLIDADGNECEGFKRPRGKCLAMNFCEVMFNSDGTALWVDIDKHVEELKERVYISILQSVCKYYVKTDNKIHIGVEWMGNFCYVKGWLLVE